MKAKSGGGINSNKRVEVGLRLGSERREVNKVAVSRLGAMQGGHATHNPKALNATAEPLYGGKALPSELGNARAYQCQPGPGGGRTVYRAGYQGRPQRRGRCQQAVTRLASSDLTFVGGADDEQTQSREMEP